MSNEADETSVKKSMASRMESWQDEHPAATLSEIEAQIDGELAQLRKELVAAAMKEGASEKEMRCPACGGEANGNGRKKRQLQIKGGETVQFERQQKRCRACGTTFFPPG